MTRIVTFTEKNSVRNFVVESDDDFNRLALKILRERYESVTYPTHDQILLIFKESIEDIVERHVNDESDNEMNSERAELEQWFRENSEFIDNLEILMTLPEDQALKYTNDKIAECDPYMAIALLEMRHHVENEGFTVHEVEEVFGFHEKLDVEETSNA